MTPHVGDAAPDAVRQWDRLVELIGCVGDVELVRDEPQPHEPDLVFTANAALVIGNLAIVSSFRHAERRREQPSTARRSRTPATRRRSCARPTSKAPATRSSIASVRCSMPATAGAANAARNAIEIGDALVMHDCSRRLRERLHDAGYRVFRTELTEFLKSGGGAKSLTLRLDDGPAVAVTAATA